MVGSGACFPWPHHTTPHTVRLVWATGVYAMLGTTNYLTNILAASFIRYFHTYHNVNWHQTNFEAKLVISFSEVVGRYRSICPSTMQLMVGIAQNMRKQYKIFFPGFTFLCFPPFFGFSSTFPIPVLVTQQLLRHLHILPAWVSTVVCQ